MVFFLTIEDMNYRCKATLSGRNDQFGIRIEDLDFEQSTSFVFQGSMIEAIKECEEAFRCFVHEKIRRTIRPKGGEKNEGNVSGLPPSND